MRVRGQVFGVVVDMKTLGKVIVAVGGVGSFFTTVVPIVVALSGEGDGPRRDGPTATSCGLGARKRVALVAIIASFNSRCAYNNYERERLSCAMSRDWTVLMKEINSKGIDKNF
jgi:hypothetical protein